MNAERAMGKFQVEVGGFYVNESKGLVHEIMREDGDGYVYRRSYDLRTGSPTGDSLMCSPGRIAQWADREATADEVVMVQRASRLRARSSSFTHRGPPFVATHFLRLHHQLSLPA
jgi:hypothetical protein